MERLINEQFCEVMMKSVPVFRLKEFFNVLDVIKELKKAFAQFTFIYGDLRSAKLKQLLLTEMPNVDQMIGEFEALITWH